MSDTQPMLFLESPDSRPPLPMDRRQTQGSFRDRGLLPPEEKPKTSKSPRFLPLNACVSEMTKHNTLLVYIRIHNLNIACCWRLCCCCYYLFCCCCCESGGIKITRGKFISRFDKWRSLVSFPYNNTIEPQSSSGRLLVFASKTLRARPESHQSAGVHQSKPRLHQPVPQRP